MTKDRTVDRKELYRMICTLGDADFQKAVSYVSFLRFVDAYQGRDPAELLKMQEDPGSGGMGTRISRSVEEFGTLETFAAVPEEAARSKESESSAEPPAASEDDHAELLDVGDFYTPVRSSRLEQTAGTESPVPEEPEISGMVSDAGLSDAVSLSAGGREETPYSRFEPHAASVLHPVPDYQAAPHSLFEQSGDILPEQEPEEKSAPYYRPEDFFMPVRSERFQQLRRSAEDDPSDISGHRTEDLAGSPFAAESEHVKEKPDVAKEELHPAKEEVAFAPEEAFDLSGAPPEANRKAALMWDRLRKIPETFRLSWSEVADLFGVPLPAVCSWFTETGPNADQEAKFEYFLDVADRVKNAAIPRVDLIVRHSLPNGESFMEKLKRQKVTGQDLKILKEMAMRSEDLRHKPKGAAKPFHSFEEAIALYSTPLYGEAEQ